jgi:hypothetical protein
MASHPSRCHDQQQVAAALIELSAPGQVAFGKTDSAWSDANFVEDATRQAGMRESARRILLAQLAAGCNDVELSTASTLVLLPTNSMLCRTIIAHGPTTVWAMETTRPSSSCSYVRGSGAGSGSRASQNAVQQARTGHLRGMCCQRVFTWQMK